MARVEDRERWSDGEVLNVDQVNIELANLVGEMNGHLDRDNLPDSLSEDKFVLDTFNTIASVYGAGGTVVTTTVSQAPVNIASASVDCEDGRLRIEAVCVAGSNGSAAASAFWALAVTVDGRLVGRSPPSDDIHRSTLRVVCSAPVSAGTHTVRLGVLYNPGDPYPSSALLVGPHFIFARSVVR
ncbi:MAG: hypothetical protein JSV86_05215 [Gemmatimonadota bacterium]|jgi:hypothetical protein|nr:MAG: hypothetical protein JSV86_05215 [Gemmatimonadota bacterium]